MIENAAGTLVHDDELHARAAAVVIPILGTPGRRSARAGRRNILTLARERAELRRKAS